MWLAELPYHQLCLHVIRHFPRICEVLAQVEMFPSGQKFMAKPCNMVGRFVYYIYPMFTRSVCVGFHNNLMTFSSTVEDRRTCHPLKQLRLEKK